MEGFKIHRHEHNPKEKEFHDKFVQNNSYNIDDLDYLVFGMGDDIAMRPNGKLSEREKRIVVSTIQWLGSPVGQNFLNECGFELKKKK